MKIAILCEGQMFGNEDVLRGRNYTTTVRCLSTKGAQLYCIKAEEYNFRMSRDDKTWKMQNSLIQEHDAKTVSKIRNDISTER